MTTVAAGTKAPAFVLRGLDGREYALREALKHGPVLVAFFKVSCPTCQLALPFLNRLHEGYGHAASLWGISQDEARDTEEFREEFGLDFPLLLDEEGYPVSNLYGLTNVPTLILIAPDGTATISFHGFVKAGLEQIAAELAQWTASKPVTVFHPHELVPDFKPG
ncbi:MAG: TlpA family protein disulfide reductase [Firmicutes bacterium]|nr:TlpA family protein disulfide reductase [Bacillota bacterium]